MQRSGNSRRRLRLRKTLRGWRRRKATAHWPRSFKKKSRFIRWDRLIAKGRTRVDCFRLWVLHVCGKEELVARADGGHLRDSYRAAASSSDRARYSAEARLPNQRCPGRWLAPNRAPQCGLLRQSGRSRHKQLPTFEE